MAAVTEAPSSTEFELLGHGARWAALARAFARGVVPQTLMLSGPAHIGKWTVARRLAQLLLCPQPVTDSNGLPAPCDSCRTCHQVKIEIFPDFKVFRPLLSSSDDERDWVVAPEQLESSIISVGQARKFRSEAQYRPTVGKRKVMILLQADRMNEQSQNALLKTFEEPAAGLTIILITEQPRKLPATILSRCWELKLSLVPDKAIDEWLEQGFPEAPADQRTEAVRVAAGRPGAAFNELARLQRLQEAGEEAVSRHSEVQEFYRRIGQSLPVAAIALTEEALRLAAEWGKEDLSLTSGDGAAAGTKAAREADSKKVERILVRSQIATFLDELSGVYRLHWHEAAGKGGAGGGEKAAGMAYGLDQIRKTRHYILRNANTNLALDVLFSRLIATGRSAGQPVARQGGR